MQYTAKVGGRDYFSDLTAIHDILGLNTRHGSATAFASLVGEKFIHVLIDRYHVCQMFRVLIFIYSFVDS